MLDTPALSDPTKPFCEEGIDETLEENKPASYDEYSGLVVSFILYDFIKYWTATRIKNFVEQ